MRRLRRGTLLALAVALVIAGVTAVYVRVELAEPEAFADRAVGALRSDAVQSVIAEEVAVDLLERRSPDLVSARPLVLTAVEAVLQTAQFERVFRRAAVTAHGVLLRGDTDVAVELSELRGALLPALRTASPELARGLPEDLRPQIATIRRSDVASSTTRAADRVSGVAWPVLGLGLLALVAFLATAVDRRRALFGAGVAVAAGGLLGALATTALEAEVVSHAGAVGVVDDDEVRAAARATWDALAGDLQRILLAVAALGTVAAGSVVLVASRVDREAVLRRGAAALAGGALPVPARVLRGLALAVLGVVVLLDLGLLARVVVAAVGLVLLVAGLAEVVTPLRTARDGRPDGDGGSADGRPSAAGRRPPRRRALVAAALAALVLVLVGVGTALVVSRDRGSDPLEPREVATCNGSAAICGRRLDQVVFPGTHNSMSAADRPGWLFANQRRPIPRQLDDGIRLLMVDPHYGVVNRDGRVRTDLQAEGTTRNRVAAQLGSDAIGAAERLAGRLGLVPSGGERRIYACHTLCELGAEGFGSVLRDVRGWMERNRSEVVVLMLESSVAPDEIEGAFRDADLEDSVVTLPRRGPMPRMRDLVTSGRRLIVLDEGDGGDASWLQPAFLFAQNTSIDGFTEDPGSCDPSRGTADSPLLIANHWVDRFPPPAGRAARVNTAEVLRRRVRACRARLGRTPNAIAVDFYGRGDLFEVVRELNRDGV
ncbi:hypothetical protein [Patulibacter sp.]|uniref:hypothetical protein n=1 Tax=Patulibacter sp. TaxID=1912859 RepID=UPI002719A5EC|nr:hypothetical protein [Patulibacter sp.]MDO9407723.1 hypothetical protein [Patulibacter sp.]